MRQNKRYQTYQLLASLTKWLSVLLRTKWLWVQVQLPLRYSNSDNLACNQWKRSHWNNFTLRTSFYQKHAFSYFLEFTFKTTSIRFMRVERKLKMSIRQIKSNLHLEIHALHTVPLTISYHLFRFLIGWYSVAEIRYFIKRKDEYDKNTSFLTKNNKKMPRNIRKYKVAFFTVNSPL